MSGYHTKGLTILSVDKDVEQWNSATLLVGMQNSTANLENSLAVSFKIKLHFLYNPFISFIDICPSETKA